jgi:DNA-binding MarR family transcriptional regulator
MFTTDPILATLHEWIGIFMRRSMRNFLLYSKEKKLSMSQIGALFRLHRVGPCGVSEISDDLGVTDAAASQMLERLVQQGLITRSEDPNDRRVKQIVLTDQGRQVLQESIHARQGWLEELARAFSPEEQGQVLAALRIMIAKATQLEN